MRKEKARTARKLGAADLGRGGEGMDTRVHEVCKKNPPDWQLDPCDSVGSIIAFFFRAFVHYKMITTMDCGARALIFHIVGDACRI